MNIPALIALVFALVLFLIAAKYRPAAPFPWHFGWAGCVALTVALLFIVGASNVPVLIALIFALVLFLIASRYRPAAPFPWHFGWLGCFAVAVGGLFLATGWHPGR